MKVGRRLGQQRTSLSLPIDDTAPSCARRRTRELLSQWGLDHLRDTVLVVVSELVTNAVRHGRPPVSMSFRYDGARLAVGVHDSQP
ncbi:MAG: ATP-binding protein, partial [Mycobacteriales bacterium]